MSSPISNSHCLDHSFVGPIFIVGMPRSGTKLLRTLLNNHSLVGITTNESGYLPYFHKNFGRYEPIEKPKNFRKFYNDFSHTTFFQRLTKNNPFINEETWFNEVKYWTYTGVIEAFYVYYAKSKNKIIWGDKTPSYMLEMPLLKSLFPSAKFIHIIRDVRDYCLSMNNAWRKNIFRASQRWNDSIAHSRRDAQKIPTTDYLEVFYEKLLSTPEHVLRETCGFLGLDFEENIVQLNAPSENLGDAKGAVKIVNNNYGKWRSMNKASITKIEKICTPLLANLGYTMDHHKDSLRLNKVEMLYYKFSDGLNFLWFEIKTNKLKGISNFFSSMKIVRKV